MLSQTLEFPTVSQSVVFRHIITLRHPHTEDEQTLIVETPTDRFVDVLREISHQRAIHNLFGYEIHETIPDYDLF
jgi:hypothetical protein